jgi:long-chain fatty acid transport protein
MKRQPARHLGALAVIACFAPLAAQATDGYFSHGYGLKAKGRGGAAIAMTDDAYGGANNPAAMVWAGGRVEVGLDLFSPRRSAERYGSAGGSLDFSVDSDKTLFAVPEFAYNTMYSKDVSLGVTVYGNGGMNTDYPGGQLNCSGFGGPSSANGLCGDGNLGVDLSQLIIAPTVAWKFSPNHSVGLSPLFAYQRFKAYGAQLFASFSGDPGNVSNNGYDTSTGWGVRVGYLGRLSDTISIGAAYASKMNMSNFDKYRGLFAGAGGFDIPENYGAGIAIKASPEVLVAVDYMRINYSGVPSVGNQSNVQAPLGSSNGPGFGWTDVDVWKIGLEYKHDNKLTLRAGYNHSDNPITPSNVTFNILAPGVVENHFTLGFTYAIDKDSEITMSYMYAFSNSVTGPSFFNNFSPPLPPGGGGTEKIEMYQNALGIAWAMRF